MSGTILTITILALAFTDNFIFAISTNVNISTNGTQSNRTSKELQGKSSKSLQVQYPELRTTARKSNSDDYNTYSSLKSDITIETSSSSAVNTKVYPSLTTSFPNFATRGRFIKNPFYFSKDDQEIEFEDDPHPDSFLNSGFPKWNRFNSNHRQLNKYGPTPLEADIMVDEDGSAGYGSTFDFGSGGSSHYESGNYRSPGNGWSGVDSMVGWFSEPITQSSQPVPIIAEIRQPSNQKMSIDINKIGVLALLKISLAKLKALGFIKAMLLVLFKLKLLIILFKFKLLMMLKFLKVTMMGPVLLSVFMLPMMLSRLSQLSMLLNQPVLVPNNSGNNDNNADNNDNAVAETRERKKHLLLQ